MALEQFSRSMPMMLLHALDTVMPRFRRVFKQFGLTEQQVRVLRVLWEKDGVLVSELAGLTLIPAPSLVGIVDRLQREGYVERRRSESDRRKIHVFVLERGKALEVEIMPILATVYAELKQSVDEESWSAALEGLQAIVDVGAAEPVGRARLIRAG